MALAQSSASPLVVQHRVLCLVFKGLPHAS